MQSLKIFILLVVVIFTELGHEKTKTQLTSYKVTQSPEFQDPIRYKEFRFVTSSKRKDTKDQITKEGREEQVLPVLAILSAHMYMSYTKFPIFN